MKDFGRTLAKGALWMVLFKLIQRSLGLVSTVILARLLVPEDFGIMAMAMSIVFVVDLLNSFGFDVVLIQKKDAKPEHFNTAWSIRLLFSALAAALLLLAAGPAASFYERPEVELIIWLLAGGMFTQGFQNIGTVQFLKELEFKKDFRMQVWIKSIAFVVTVPLAFYLRNYWALLAGVLVGYLARVGLSYLMSAYRPRFTLRAWRELLGFSSWLVANNLLLFLRMRSADFVLGKLGGAKQLGVFSVAYEIAHLPATELVMPINRAMFPGYSKIADNLDRFRHEYLNAVAVISLFAFPACLGIAGIADVLVPVFLGDKWLDTIPLIKLLALHSMFLALQLNIGSAFLALGRPRLITLLGCGYVVVLIPLLIFLVGRMGPIGAAWAYLIAAVTVAPIGLAVMLKLMSIGVSSFVATQWRSLTAAALMYLTVKEFIDLAGHQPTTLNAALFLVLSVLLGAAVYAALVAVLWFLSGRPDGAERSILNTTKAKLRALLGARYLGPDSSPNDN